jgi:DNA modification methylase
MPTLQFKGKNIVWNHHLSLPYHTLEEVPTLHFHQEQSDGNLIIEGDNLLALKSLLPIYANRIKCIYIDPPYNTGNESWVYNDRVSSPLIQAWLGQSVGKDDLTRHDKWLCMMTPRLKLLRDLLSDKGAIFISLDENELFNCKALMDNIFGEENFKNLIVIRKGIKSVQAQFETIDRLNYGIEYLLVYTKDAQFRFKKFEIELENAKGGTWNNHWRGTDRPSMRYELFGIKPTTGQWRWGEQRSKIAIENYKQCMADISKNEQEISQEEIDRWFVSKTEETGEEPDLLRISHTGKPEHYVPPSESKLASSHWSDLKPNGSSQLKAIFGKKVFETPKSTDLVKRIISFVEGDDKDIIVLDSFAGSGTTMHAVMELNKEDGGIRKCILVQMNENQQINICRDITRERIKKAIEKYGYKSGFSYLKVGIQIDEESLLAGQLPNYQQFAEYVYYLATGKYLEDKSKINPTTGWIGEINGQSIYLLYHQDYEILTSTALDIRKAEMMLSNDTNKRKIVYAPVCFLDESYLEEKHIEFVQIPYQLFENRR